MTHKELVGQLKKLRQIEPQKNWASLTKTQIMGVEPKFVLFPHFKPAFAGLIAVFILFGFFGYGFVRDAIPGDLLYVVKKVANQGQAIFVSEQEKPVFQLKLANDRLEDLTKASARNLAPTIFEFRANIFEAARDLVKMDTTTSDSMVMKQIIEETKKLEENKQKVESLGLILGEDSTNELDNAYKILSEREIRNLDNNTLTEDQEKLLEEAKEFFEKGDYLDALVKVIEASQIK